MSFHDFFTKDDQRPAANKWVEWSQAEPEPGQFVTDGKTIDWAAYDEACRIWMLNKPK